MTKKKGSVKPRWQIKLKESGYKLTTPREIILDILNNKEKGPKRDIILLNAAATLYLAGKARDIKEAIIQASNCIDSGRALKKLQLLRQYSLRK